MSVLDPGMDGTAGFAPEAAPPSDAGDEPFPLPPLREDLTLLPAAADRGGAPGWTIFDAVRNRYFRIGHAAFEMLRRWGHGRSDRLIAAVRAETVLDPAESDLEALVRFLRANGLLQREDSGALGEFDRIRRAGEPALWKWAVHNYLFVRVPLVRPTPFLRATRGLADAIAAPAVQWTILGLGLLGVMLAMRQWDQFLATFQAFANWQGAVWAALVLTAAKILHELGHAYTALRYGCRVPTMGLAFLVLYPVLYTDTSDSWRLVSRAQRLRIGSAGIRVELALALIATFLWSFMPEGPARSAVFLIATATWISTLLINLNPFLRFDGYYLLSDALDVPNLQPRAFALTRWWLRERLFGLGLPAPEPMDAGMRRTLVFYGFATWIYRFFLFIGIALIVYHFFFKTLGLLLFAVEIVWFILLPVGREIVAWAGLRRHFRINRNLVATLAVLGVGLWAFLTPWDTTIRAPALWRAAGSAQVLTALPARLVAIEVEPGARVAAGQTLYRFEAPDLAARRAVLGHRLDTVEIALDQALGSSEGQRRVGELTQERARLKASLSELAALENRLTVRASIAGTLRDVPPDLHAGRWIGPRTALGRVVAPEGELSAYVEQEALSRLQTGAGALFYPEDPGRAAIGGRIAAIDPLGTDGLPGGYLAAPLGGPIEARSDDQGTYRPLGAVYRVRIAPETSRPPDSVVRGTVHLDGPAESWAERLWTRVAAIVIRESGF